MKKILYISLMWIATLMLILSPVMLHHHHGNQICMIEEKCIIDGNINDRHTSHPQNEEDECSLQQLNNAISNAKSVQNVFDALTPYFPCLSAILTNIIIDCYDINCNAFDWFDALTVTVLPKAEIAIHSRRGPPIL